MFGQQKNLPTQTLPDSVEMFSDFSPFFRFTGKLEIIKPLRSGGRSRREDVENTKSLGGAGEMRKRGAAVGGEKGGLEKKWRI